MDRIYTFSAFLSLVGHCIAFTLFSVSNIEGISDIARMEISFVPPDEPIYEMASGDTLSFTSLLEESDVSIFALPSLKGFSRTAIGSEIGILHNTVLWKDEPDLMRVGIAGGVGEKIFIKETPSRYLQDPVQGYYRALGPADEFFEDDKNGNLYFQRDDVVEKFRPEIAGPAKTRNLISYGFTDVDKDFLKELGNGEVLLRFWIDDEGTVKFVMIELSSQNSRFDNLCVGEVRRWRFGPFLDSAGMMWGKVRLKAAEIARGQ